MVLEAVMLCIDNSEWSRNGDYHPTRFDSSVESINLIASAKIQSNPETCVGLLSMANGARGVYVNVSLTRNNGAIMNALAKDIKISGNSNYLSALRTAALALKNRSNKNQRQRIIMFVASPMNDVDSKELIKLGKSFKKNNIAVDIINFGTENTSNENTEKLEQFVAAVNTSDNSHLLNIPPGPHILADLILDSAIMADSGGVARAGGSGAVGTAAASGGGAAAAGGIDPNVDPEMAMAIRMSMEEERQRQQRLTQQATTASTTSTTTATTANVNNANSNSNAGGGDVEMDDDEMLQQAIAMSMAQADNNNDNSNSNTNNVSATAATGTSTAATLTNTNTNNAGSSDVDAALSDPNFISELLSSVPGANPSSDDLLDELTGANKDNKNNNNDNNKKNDKK